MTYSNPVIPGFHPDPSVCRVGADYYLVTSSFEFFPGVPIFHSGDLVHWEQIGHCLGRKSQLSLEDAPCSGGIWAPTIRYNDGVFYMITANVSKGGCFYVTTADPWGEWSDPIWINHGDNDPSLFFDDDGKAYYTGTADIGQREGIYQAEIDMKTGKLTGEYRLVWEGSGGSYPEGPHIYKIGNMYYLMISEGGSQYGHMLTAARSESPWGPFESCPRNPVLTHRNRGSCEVQGTGHGDLVQAHDGSWWMVFLAFRNSAQFFHHLGRETFLAPVGWDSDGWPVVNGNGTVDLQMDSRTLAPAGYAEQPVRDDFDAEKMGNCWNYIRNPDLGAYSTAARPGWLLLTGSEKTLDDIGSPVFIGRRQQHFGCRAATLIDFNPHHEGEEAGLTVLYNNEHHYEIGIGLIGGARCVFVRRRIGDLSAVVALEKIGDGPVVLQIAADRHAYALGYGADKENVRTLCFGGTQYLSTESVRLGFTGVFFGLYATGNGKASTVPACFDWFDYEHF
jgi:xylan 1,4-beta-xylosidase